MRQSRSEADVRRELTSLIADAVAELDPGRRRALLTLADHWSDILRRRRGSATDA